MWAGHDLATLCASAAGGHLLRVYVVHGVRQPQALQHEVAPRLQQLAHDAVWLAGVPLQQQDPPPILPTVYSGIQTMMQQYSIAFYKPSHCPGAPHTLQGGCAKLTLLCEYARAAPATPAPMTKRSHTCGAKFRLPQLTASILSSSPSHRSSLSMYKSASQKVGTSQNVKSH